MPVARPPARAVSLPADDPRRTLPDLGPEACLIGWLLEAGPLAWDAQGNPRGLDWPALAAWQGLSQTALSPWQARALHGLSAVYAAAVAAALDADAPAPDWHGETSAAAAAEVARQVQAVFGALARRGAAGAGSPGGPAAGPAQAMGRWGGY